jgi:hypothetical protein
MDVQNSLQRSLGVRCLCPVPQQLLLSSFEECWENVPIWNPVSFKSSLPLLLGAKRRLAFCRNIQQVANPRR